MMISSQSWKCSKRFCVFFCVVIMLWLPSSAVQSKTKSVIPIPRSMYSDDSCLPNLPQWVDMDTFVAEWMLRSRFGEFQRIVFDCIVLPDYPHQDSVYTDSYSYLFQEKSGDSSQQLAFHIEKLPSNGEVRFGFTHFDSIKETVSVINKNDLRTAEGDGFYRVRDMRYYYDQNMLSCIYWTTESYAFCLDFDENKITDYDLDSGTFASQFLRESTAERAVDRFNAHIMRCLMWGKFCRHWLLWILGAMLAGAAVVTEICIRRKAKKKKSFAG